MASIETLLEQVSKSDLDITALLKLRSAVEDKINAVRREIEKQLQALDGGGSSTAAPRRGRPAGKRRAGRKSANTPGRHQGLSVAEAVRKEPLFISETAGRKEPTIAELEKLEL